MEIVGRNDIHSERWFCDWYTSQIWTHSRLITLVIVEIILIIISSPRKSLNLTLLKCFFVNVCQLVLLGILKVLAKTHVHIIIVFVCVRELIFLFFCDFYFIVFTDVLINTIYSAEYTVFVFLGLNWLSHHYSLIMPTNIIFFTHNRTAKSSNDIIIIIYRPFLLKLSIGLISLL